MAVAVFAVLLGRRVIAVGDRREMSWLDAWAKTAVIVMVVVVGVVYIPAKASAAPLQRYIRCQAPDVTLGVGAGHTLACR